MHRKRNLLFFISALVLIPILLGLTPVKFFQKLGSGCPFGQNKTVLQCTPCIYHSVTSQEETGEISLTALRSSNAVPDPALMLSGDTVDSAVPIVSNLFSEAPPLRC
jgi:hypothetical protein